MGWFTLVSDRFALTCEVCGHGPLSWNVDQPELQKWMSGGKWREYMGAELSHVCIQLLWMHFAFLSCISMQDNI